MHYIYATISFLSTTMSFLLFKGVAEHTSIGQSSTMVL